MAITKATGNVNNAFRDINRIGYQYRPIEVRRCDFSEVEIPMSETEIQRQAMRCMNCGIPFCHGLGCPLGNLIPDFNHNVVRGKWHEAWDLLSQTSPFPEFTSRICPALCEGSCTSGMEFGSVSVRQIEKRIVEKAYENGWVKPQIPAVRNGRTATVIGAGPSGLAAAVTLNQLGYHVVVYEKNKKPGGLLRYGIPDFKLAKEIIDRRLRIMEDSEIEFICGAEIGRDLSANYIASKSDLVIVTTGTPVARDLPIPGREQEGIHFALELLVNQNRVHSGELSNHPISISGKRVLVIGGGDTGSDCVGTALRRGAAQVTQIEIMPQPPKIRSASTPWPAWPYILRTSSSHEEGCTRRWALSSLCFHGSNGRLTGVEVLPVVWEFDANGKPLRFNKSKEKSSILACNLVFLAMGFLKPDYQEQLKNWGIEVEDQKKFHFAGDAANGPSLVVRAIANGILVAKQAAV